MIIVKSRSFLRVYENSASTSLYLWQKATALEGKSSKWFAYVIGKVYEGNESWLYTDDGWSNSYHDGCYNYPAVTIAVGKSPQQARRRMKKVLRREPKERIDETIKRMSLRDLVRQGD